jgi:hypothetical protein
MDLLDELEKSEVTAQDRVLQNEDDKADLSQFHYVLKIYYTHTNAKSVATDISIIDSIFEKTDFIDRYVISRLETDFSQENIEGLALETVCTRSNDKEDEYDEVKENEVEIDGLTPAKHRHYSFYVNVHFEPFKDVEAKSVLSWITEVCKFMVGNKPINCVFKISELEVPKEEDDDKDKEKTQLRCVTINSLGCKEFAKNSLNRYNETERQFKEVFSMFFKLPKKDDEDDEKYNYRRNEEICSHISKAVFYYNYREKINELRRNGYVQPEIIYFNSMQAYDAIELRAKDLITLARRAYLLSAIIHDEKDFVKGVDSFWLRDDMIFYNGILEYRAHPIDKFCMLWDAGEDLQKFLNMRRKVTERNFASTMKEIENYVNNFVFDNYELCSDDEHIVRKLVDKTKQIIETIGTNQDENASETVFSIAECLKNAKIFEDF